MNLKEKYKKEIVPTMMSARGGSAFDGKETGHKNIMAVPKLEKAVINVGLSKALKDPKYLEVIENTLIRITGQRPVKTKAKKSIASFKIRQGLVVGMKVTLRHQRMYDFVDKLINVTLPRIRDFRGLSPKAVDLCGNLNIGLKEHIAFPEIEPDEVEKLHGLEVSIVTTARNHDEGLKFLKLLGFPFKE